MSDVIVDDEVGNDDVESSRDIADDDSASRWTTERAEDGKAMSPKAPMQKNNFIPSAAVNHWFMPNFSNKKYQIHFGVSDIPDKTNYSDILI